MTTIFGKTLNFISKLKFLKAFRFLAKHLLTNLWHQSATSHSGESSQ